MTLLALSKADGQPSGGEPESGEQENLNVCFHEDDRDISSDGNDTTPGALTGPVVKDFTTVRLFHWDGAAQTSTNIRVPCVFENFRSVTSGLDLPAKAVRRILTLIAQDPEQHLRAIQLPEGRLVPVRADVLAAPAEYFMLDWEDGISEGKDILKLIDDFQTSDINSPFWPDGNDQVPDYLVVDIVDYHGHQRYERVAALRDGSLRPDRPDWIKRYAVVDNAGELITKRFMNELDFDLKVPDQIVITAAGREFKISGTD